MTPDHDPGELMHTETLLEIETTVRAGQALVRVNGEIDLATAPKLRDELTALSEDGIHNVHVDLSRATFMDSTALAVLLAALRRCQHAGGRLVLVDPSPMTARLLHTTRLGRLFGLPS